jgi:hypothetical protein
VLNLSISLEPDCNKKKWVVDKPSATDAVIEPVNILSANPPPPPGNEDVTYSIPLLVSTKTLFKEAPPGGKENGKTGSTTFVAFKIILVLPYKSTLSDFTSKLPVDLKEPDIIWSPLNVLEPVVANTEDAVLFSNKEFLEKEELKAYEELIEEDT